MILLRFFPDQVDDVLNVSGLPRTDQTELNYRTKPLTEGQELRLALLFLMGPAPIALLLGVPFWLVTAANPRIYDLTAAAVPVLVVWLIVRRLMNAIVRWEIFGSLAFFAASCFAALWNMLTSLGTPSWYAATFVGWLLAVIVGRQVAAWHLASPTVDYERLQRWQVNLPSFIPRGWSLDCPELLTIYASPLLIAGAVWGTVRMTEFSTVGKFLWPLSFVATAHIIWFAWHAMVAPIMPWPNYAKSWRRTFEAIVVFATYDPHHTRAAGVFRFPSRWLRNPIHRWLFLGTSLLLLAFGGATLVPTPIVLRQEKILFGGLFLNLVVCSIGPPAVLMCTVWLASGTLLARFSSEFEDLTPGVTEWDNYIDRIINSKDELEREHILIGTSEIGDYPIMVHSEIHDQHAHILGDSGASKTALGIAPQVTQKIARGDSTVVVVDLKGDRALFETCRREAARTKKLKFRWLSNEVGKTTFGFNPFLQTHNQKLSVEQLTQQLLQGLSLDYGIQYGAGYFTAMNEIVLNNVMHGSGARSFQELSGWLSNRRWYSSIGHEDDWKQARHLGSLVSRLAGSPVVNLTPDQIPNRPDVHSQVLDATNLLEEPQVVYLWLRSALEPTNAPSIARLFLWSMFTAASHQPNDGNRVYFFIDEMQQIISDGIKLVFEQFRDLGGTIVGAHQTASQLRRQGTDLGDTIDSCTAMKQIFRASDLNSLEQLEKLSGTKVYKSPQWYQLHERGMGELTERYDPLMSADGLVRVSEQERARHDRNDLMAISARRQSSLVRFTFDSGYTQFAGAPVPVVSQFHISFEEYQRRRQLPWPTAPGAFEVEPPRRGQSDNGQQTTNAGKSTQALTAVPATSSKTDEERYEEFIKGGKDLK